MSNSPMETLNYCPECLNINIEVKIRKLDLSPDEFAIICPECSFQAVHTVFSGLPVLNPKNLEALGFPGELLDHMDVYKEDVDKLMRLGVSEFILKMASYQLTSEVVFNLHKHVNELLLSPHLNIGPKCFLVIAENHNNCYCGPLGGQKCSKCDIIIQIENIVKTLTWDITSKYKKTVEVAFSKITNYTFPDDFVKFIRNL